jgi:hypothetical protein
MTVPTEYNPDDPRLLKAAKDSGLAAEYRNAPDTLRFYMRKLLIWGWAGQKSPEESKYITLARAAYGKGPSEAQAAAHRRRADLARKTEKCSQARESAKTHIPSILSFTEAD